MFSHLIISIWVTLVLTGCGQGSQGNRTKARRSSTVVGSAPPARQEGYVASLKRGVQIASDLSNLDEFALGMNRYSWQVEAFGGSTQEQLASCQIQANASTHRHLPAAHFDRTGTARVSFELVDSDPVSGELVCSVSDRGVLLADFRHPLKKSILVHGELSARSLDLAHELGTLVLMPGAVLTTHGAAVSLRFEELVSVDARIRTLAETSLKAPPERPGLSPGEVRISLGRAVGQLTIELRGQHGGDAVTARPAITAVPARSPELNGQCQGYHRPDDQRCFGKKGHTGYPGENGMDGAPGGNSGRVVFSVKDGRQLRLRIKKIPGVGGAGLPGGSGGPGGPGGIGAHITWSYPDNSGCSFCFGTGGETKNNPLRLVWEQYKFPDGPPGDRGANGSHGATGESGVRSESEVRYLREDLHLVINDNWESRP